MGRQQEAQVLERGSIYFAYRPKFDKDEAHGLKDVQQVYMILEPEQGRRRYRLAVLGHKTFPEPIRGDTRKYWGFVAQVVSNPRAIVKELEGKTARTRSGGEHEMPPARPAGEGVYALVRHGDHAHLAYELELPEQPGPVQRDLHIQREGSFVCSIRNPRKGAPGGPGMPSDLHAKYPPQIQARFNDRVLAAADPDMLDVDGCEFILLSGVANPEHEFQIHLARRHETEETAEIFSDLHMQKDRQPIEPLLKGTWR